MHVTENTGGIIETQPTIVIFQYGNYMGGLDFAAMRILHWNATVMGLNQYWLKLLFYFLDVDTENDLVLYRPFIDNESMKISNFNPILVIILVVKQTKYVPSLLKEFIHQLAHICMKNIARSLCAYCDFFLWKRENDKSENLLNTTKNDIVLDITVVQERAEITFVLDHHTSEILRVSWHKYLTMSAKTNKNY